MISRAGRRCACAGSAAVAYLRWLTLIVFADFRLRLMVQPPTLPKSLAASAVIRWTPALAVCVEPSTLLL